MIFKERPEPTEAQNCGDEHYPYVPIRRFCKKSLWVMNGRQRGEVVKCPECGEFVHLTWVRPQFNWMSHVVVIERHGDGVVGWTDAPFSDDAIKLQLGD